MPETQDHIKSDSVLSITRRLEQARMYEHYVITEGPVNKMAQCLMSPRLRSSISDVPSWAKADTKEGDWKARNDPIMLQIIEEFLRTDTPLSDAHINGILDLMRDSTLTNVQVVKKIRQCIPEMENDGHTTLWHGLAVFIMQSVDPTPASGKKRQKYVLADPTFNINFWDEDDPSDKQSLTSKTDVNANHGRVGGAGRDSGEDVDVEMDRSGNKNLEFAKSKLHSKPSKRQSTASANNLTEDSYVTSGGSVPPIKPSGSSLPPSGSGPRLAPSGSGQGVAPIGLSSAPSRSGPSIAPTPSGQRLAQSRSRSHLSLSGSGTRSNTKAVGSSGNVRSRSPRQAALQKISFATFASTIRRGVAVIRKFVKTAAETPPQFEVLQTSDDEADEDADPNDVAFMCLFKLKKRESVIKEPVPKPEPRKSSVEKDSTISKKEVSSSGISVTTGSGSSTSDSDSEAGSKPTFEDIWQYDALGRKFRVRVTKSGKTQYFDEHGNEIRGVDQDPFAGRQFFDKSGRRVINMPTIRRASDGYYDSYGKEYLNIGMEDLDSHEIYDEDGNLVVNAFTSHNAGRKIFDEMGELVLCLTQNSTQRKFFDIQGREIANIPEVSDPFLKLFDETGNELYNIACRPSISQIFDEDGNEVIIEVESNDIDKDSQQSVESSKSTPVGEMSISTPSAEEPQASSKTSLVGSSTTSSKTTKSSLKSRESDTTKESQLKAKTETPPKSIASKQSQLKGPSLVISNASNTSLTSEPKDASGSVSQSTLDQLEVTPLDEDSLLQDTSQPIITLDHKYDISLNEKENQLDGSAESISTLDHKYDISLNEKENQLDGSAESISTLDPKYDISVNEKENQLYGTAESISVFQSQEKAKHTDSQLKADFSKKSLRVMGSKSSTTSETKRDRNGKEIVKIPVWKKRKFLNQEGEEVFDLMHAFGKGEKVFDEMGRELVNVQIQMKAARKIFDGEGRKLTSQSQTLKGRRQAAFSDEVREQYRQRQGNVYSELISKEDGFASSVLDVTSDEAKAIKRALRGKSEEISLRPHPKEPLADMPQVPADPVAPDASLDAAAYMEKHGINQIFELFLNNLVMERPHNPLEFLLDLIHKIGICKGKDMPIREGRKTQFTSVLPLSQSEIEDRQSEFLKLHAARSLNEGSVDSAAEDLYGEMLF